MACRKGHLEIARVLLDHGADVNVKDDSGRTPLFHASYGNHAETVKVLIERGADANTKTESGETALASIGGHGDFEKISRLLIERGADVNAKNNYFQSAHTTAPFIALHIVKVTGLRLLGISRRKERMLTLWTVTEERLCLGLLAQGGLR